VVAAEAGGVEAVDVFPLRADERDETNLLPHLGRIPLRSLTPMHLERLYDHLLTAGARKGGPLAPKTVLNVHQIVRKALGDAMRKGLVIRNVARPWRCHLSSTVPMDGARRCQSINSV
jgi:hypothetical protein